MLTLLLIACVAGISMAWDNATTPLSTFRSRPDLLSTSLDVTLHEGDAVSNGMVFVGAYPTEQPGPYIFDKRGVSLGLLFPLVPVQGFSSLTKQQNLVWSGFSVVGAENAHNVHVCQFRGSAHLCLFQGHQFHGYGRGHGVILDTDYRVAASVQTGNEAVPMDQHEFRLISNGTAALVAIYQQQAFDMTFVGLFSSQGWIMDSLFQEIDTTDGSVIFEWSAAAHVDPFKSYVYPLASDIVGDGLTSRSAWDFFHINSIGKSQLTGNYIVSARHMSTIYYIDGRNGAIIWRLQAGNESDFACKDFSFSFQHDAQIRAENETSMTLSIFDNASNGFNTTSETSKIKIVTLDYKSRTASLDLELTYPHEDLHVPSQGNTQFLDNGNIFVGYGGWPRMSEHTPDGKAVWAAQFGTEQGVVMSYRCSAAEWHAIPNNTRPALWAYSWHTGAPLVLYVSWNGCTEVETWDFYGAEVADGELTKLGTARKEGFETSYKSETHFAFVLAQAVDAGGRVLRSSSRMQVFVPSAALAGACNESGCPEG